MACIRLTDDCEFGFNDGSGNKCITDTSKWIEGLLR